MAPCKLSGTLFRWIALVGIIDVPVIVRQVIVYGSDPSGPPEAEEGNPVPATFGGGN